MSKMKSEVDRYIRMRHIIQLWTQPQQRPGCILAPKFTLHQVSLIDTKNIQKSWAAQCGCIQRFLCKMAVDQLATGRYMKRMKFWPSDKCPRCMESNETTLHVLKCPAATQLFNQKSTELVTMLQQYPTKPELIQGIQLLFQTFLSSSNEEPLHLTTTPPTATDDICVRQQLQLPLHEFMRGCIVTHWRTSQEQFQTRIHSRRSANRWAQSLIQGIWQLYFSLWLHHNEAYYSDPVTQNNFNNSQNSTKKSDDNGP